MTTITRRFEWDMGHRVTNHASKCRNLHGHRYVALFTMLAPLVNEPSASDYGMVIDFGDVKSLLGEMIEQLDHGFMVWDKDPFWGWLLGTETKVISVPFVPTAENIAQMLLEQSSLILKEKRITVTSVEVWETPNCKATATITIFEALKMVTQIGIDSQAVLANISAITGFVGEELKALANKANEYLEFDKKESR